ncbi:hypothetical protein ALC53_03281 [Atta colombica]|uniref:Uncharacterized protein n=1 Tax=Atta colombica TaxID=520822 RepID=A0A195BQ94_9HYME|nr:hypothetical protein ALC53_03281 [Atta colombica]
MRSHKVLLFSTMTMMILDMIEDYLLLRDYNYIRLDVTAHMYGVKYATHISLPCNTAILLYQCVSRSQRLKQNMNAALYYLRFLCDGGEFYMNERRECTEDVMAIRQVLALLFAKSQSRVLKMSDESVETNLVNFEFPVSLCLLKEGRKNHISMVWLIGAGMSTILFWRKNRHQSVSKFVGMKNYSVVR